SSGASGREARTRSTLANPTEASFASGMAASIVHSVAPASDVAITPFITVGSGDVDSRPYAPKGFTVSISRRLRLLKLTANVQTSRSSRHHAAGLRPCDIPIIRPDSGRRAARHKYAPHAAILMSPPAGKAAPNPG